MFGLRSKLKKRDPVEPRTQFKERFEQHGVSPENFLAMWSEISDCLAVSELLIRPEDNLNSLAGQGEISPRMELLTDCSKVRAKGISGEIDLTSITTVEDYILALRQR